MVPGNFRSRFAAARVEAHARASATFDPWIGVALGGLQSWADGLLEAPCTTAHKCLAPAADVSLGLDLRLDRSVAFGIFLPTRLPFRSRAVNEEERVAIWDALPSVRAIFWL